MEKANTFIAVDASARGNPGPTEYQIVTETKTLIYGSPVFHGTNNIGEFLALVHAIAHAKKNDMSVVIYSDSVTAMAWVRNKKHSTTLVRNEITKQAWDLLDRAETWLCANSYPKVDVRKWPTKEWGEIPADFGRK